jgi:2-C-methyl-D-erythritol 4-phosphate cytidylyltransferase
MAYAIIPAAGRGVRFGGKQPKQFLTLGGLPMIIRALSPFQSSPLIDEIVCVVSKDEIASFERLIREHSFTKVKRIVPGGDQRQDSARAGAACLEKEKRPEDIVLVHDGVRWFPSL